MPRTSAVNMKCPRSEHAGSRVKLTVLTENPATDDSAIRACQEGAESRTCSPSFCRGRSPGTARANTASGSSSDAKDPRRLATTSSLSGGYPERIVCDGHGGMLAAIEARWPKAELHQCE